MIQRILLICLAAALFSCNSNPKETGASDTLFEKIDAREVGITFSNDLYYTEDFNPYTYRNFFNGGGVGVGDVNNDGFADLYFCGNLVDNQLLINQGDFSFTDITSHAGVACEDVWSSGVSFVDINDDGWLDLYVCKSGAPGGKNRHNELFINNGDPDEQGRVTFREEAEAWGIDDLGLSSHAAFFDYDRDGDLDCYLLNNSIRSVGGYDLIPGQREIRDTLGGNKLYRNEGNRFVDVSEEAGIFGSAIGFGLGVTIGDVNLDGWADIYVSNDFFERDYLYLNNQDGTFTEDLPQMLRELSLSSMGADMGDLNNDGFPEIFVTDMLPQGDARMKSKTAFEDWDKYQLTVRQGYHHQFVRNVLQLNNRNNTFSEIGRMSGVNATDWSWGALMFDFQNDGYKDIFVANGIFKDLTDQDYIRYYASPYAIVKKLKEDNAVIEDLVDAIPSEPIPNYAFVNQGPEEADSEFWAPMFRNEAEALGLSQPGFSNGSAYVDLDNDGDLDLVTNNIAAQPGIYRNHATQKHPENHWIGFMLTGPEGNQGAIGTTITVDCDDRSTHYELHPMKGFQSCVDSRPLLGLGTCGNIQRVLIRWPDGLETELFEITADQYHEISYAEAERRLVSVKEQSPLFVETDFPLEFAHQENEYSDFNRDRLLFHMASAEGPAVAWGDVNGDGEEDLFIGGAKGQASRLFLATSSGFRSIQEFEDVTGEAVDAELFDANGDGRDDLYICYGSSEYGSSSLELLDRFFLNRSGKMMATDQLFSHLGRFPNSGCVAAGDADGDGDLDLFVGERMRNGLYGVPGDGMLLQNDGTGTFTKVESQLAPQMKEHSLFCDAQWIDFDKDGDQDLITCGEWSEVTVWTNQAGRFSPQPISESGWWSSLEIADLNGDGLPDLILGNHGLNSRFKAEAERPVELFVNDFDGNGSAEQLITVFEGDTAYPLVLRHDLVKQLPGLSRKYPSYASFRLQSMDEIFSLNQLKSSVRRTAQELRSGVAYQQEDGSFRFEEFPSVVQTAPIKAISVEDIDGDGNPDLILAGNELKAKPEVGIHHALYGQVLMNRGEGQWQVLPSTGLDLEGTTVHLKVLEKAGRKILLAVKNNDQVQSYLFPEPQQLQVENQ